MLISTIITRVNVQGVKSLGGHFACLCRGFEFYEVKIIFFVIIFQKENGNTFTLFIFFIVKSLQKEQNSTNLLLWFNTEYSQYIHTSNTSFLTITLIPNICMFKR